ncbi:hypothetical protein SBA2_120027 [Acidobacteriia bacterium SbA2]|nr:hypothetical protein SBA2_120027 [Acidobacteriia bacterium SbA2]
MGGFLKSNYSTSRGESFRQFATVYGLRLNEYDFGVICASGRCRRGYDLSERRRRHDQQCGT